MPKEFQENISTGENKKETLPAQLDISNENKEKVPENLQSYGGFFKIKIPNERQGAIEYDLEEICRLQGCTIEDVLRINHLTIAQLKPGKIVIIPITLWDKNDKEIEHKIEPGLHEIEWSNETPSEEAQRMAQWIATNHVTDTSLIFDKKTARMYIIKNGKMMYSTIFLSGKNNKTDIMNFP
ncbi:hypothetical protein H6768_06545 [Candidatus Peribacteria bacterium]|nr:hypothetical protein [Candidatus Peribacteria bacterium]